MCWLTAVWWHGVVCAGSESYSKKQNNNTDVLDNGGDVANFLSYMTCDYVHD